MFFCSDEILEEADRSRGEDGEWSEDDIELLEQMCRERNPFERR
jgi:hypothetical protein